MVRQIHPVDVEARLKQGENLLLLDVRQPHEHDYCHLAGSVLIPLGELHERIQELDVEPEQTIIVYCHHGVRSLSGAAILQNGGFRNVFSMAGGIDAWTTYVDPTIPRY